MKPMGGLRAWTSKSISPQAQAEAHICPTPILNPDPLNPKPYTLNPKLWTLNPEPRTISATTEGLSTLAQKTSE